jgi:hypothetical protein
VTLSEEQFRERLVDYLYEELAGEELQAFEAYLRESAAARRELAQLQATLRTARQGIAESSEDEPPARVRHALLAAAEAHARASEPRAVQTGAEPERGGLWGWWRASWLLPTLGVAAAVGLVVFGKHSTSLQVERAPAPIVTPQPAEPAAEVASPPPPPAAPSTAQPAASEPQPQAAANSAQPQAAATTAQPAASRGLAAGARDATQPARTTAPRRASRAPAQGFALPPPAWDAKRAPEAPAKQEAPSHPDALSMPGAARARSPQPAPSARQDKASAAPAAAPSQAADALEGSDTLSGLAEPVQADAVPSAYGSADDSARKPAQQQAARAPDTLVRRAHDFLVAQRWQQAAADYRELLRRYPADSRAAVWKKQLALAMQALHEADTHAH